MTNARYLWLVNLDDWFVEYDDSTSRKGFRPSELVELAGMDIFAPGKCATIKIGDGVIYVAGSSRCAPRLWREATGSDDGRPNAPWVAFRSVDFNLANDIAWSWLEQRSLV